MQMKPIADPHYGVWRYETLFSRSTVWKVVSYDWRCQNVPLSIKDMFVIDHKENVYLINHKIICD